MVPETLIACRKMIADWHKWGKISSVKLDGKEYSRATTEQIMTAETLYISKKYLDMFVASNMVDIVHKNFIESPREFLVITDKGKIKDFNISTHARRQFLRRYFVCGQDALMSKHLSKVVLNGFSMMKTDIADIIFKEDYTNPMVTEMIISFLKIASTSPNISSARDKRELKKRHDRYDNTVFMFSHPFMFVVADGMITTIELSSQSFDCRNANKLTSSTYKWKQYFEQFLSSYQPL